MQQFWPEWSQLNGLDWFIIVVITLSIMISLWRGFAREAMSLAGWILAFMVANLFASLLASYLAGFIANLTGRYIVAWALLFVLILVVCGLLARLVATASLDNEAARLGVSVGDERVLEEIVAIPTFQGLDGDFDREAYEFTLEQNNLTASQFEANVRRDTARTRVRCQGMPMQRYALWPPWARRSR